MDNDEAISRTSFSILVLYDRRYQGKMKDMNQFLESLFQAFDRDSSGELSFREYLQGKKLIESNNLRDNIRFIFNLLDLSRDKKIEKDEINTFLKTVHKSGGMKDEAMSDEEYAAKMLCDLDLNKDGAISQDEFVDGIVKNERYVNFIRSIKPENLSA